LSLCYWSMLVRRLRLFMVFCCFPFQARSRGCEVHRRRCLAESARYSSFVRSDVICKHVIPQCRALDPRCSFLISLRWSARSQHRRRAPRLFFFTSVVMLQRNVAAKTAMLSTQPSRSVVRSVVMCFCDGFVGLTLCLQGQT